VAGTDLAHFTVIVTFDGPIESMTLTVVVPDQSDKAATEALAIARAKELARQFASSMQP